MTRAVRRATGWNVLAATGAGALVLLVVLGWNLVGEGLIPLLLAALVLLGSKERPADRDAALLLAGFIGDWLVLAPVLFVSPTQANGIQAALPQADTIAGIATAGVAAVGLWALACPILVRKHWPAAVLLGLGQVWIALMGLLAAVGVGYGAYF